jgi:hypothetical protein
MPKSSYVASSSMYFLAASFAFGSLGSWLTVAAARSLLSPANYSPSPQTFPRPLTNPRRRLFGSARIAGAPCISRRSCRPFNSRAGADSSIHLNHSPLQFDAATCTRTLPHRCALFEVSIRTGVLPSSPKQVQLRTSAFSASRSSAVELLSPLPASS